LLLWLIEADVFQMHNFINTLTLAVIVLDQKHSHINRNLKTKRIQKSKDDKFNLNNTVLTILFFAGLILQVFAIGIYRNTIIDWKVTSIIWLFTGLISQRFTATILNTYYRTTNYFMQLFFNVCSFGGMMAFCFLSINYYFNTEAQTEIVKTLIVKTGHLAKGRHGCENPYADVEIQNTTKQLVFPCDTEIEKYKFVSLTIRKGFLGFYIIADRKLSFSATSSP
jgi:hypothetical protein